MSRIDRIHGVRHTFAAAALAVAVVVMGATMSAEARSITGAIVSKSGSATILNVTFETGSPGDSHALYLAYAPSDMGTSIADWPVFQRVKIVGADETSAAVVPQFIGDGNTVCRAFLVENAYPFDTPVEAIRQTGTQYIDTEINPDPTTFASLDFKFDEAVKVQQRVFGVSAGSANFSFDAYINGAGYWASACTDGSGDFKASSLGAEASRVTVSLDAASGNLVIYNHVTHASTTDNRSTTRTKTSVGSLYIFCQHSYESSEGAPACFAAGGLVYGGAITTNNVPARSFQPCALGGRAGLYDAVSGRIFWSAVADDDFQIGGASVPFAPAESETQVAVSDAVSLATRAITDVTFSTADSVTTVNVTFDAGAAGDNHALYVAYAPADMGAQLAGWTALQRVKIVGADETSATFTLLPQVTGAGNTVFRVFLVDSAYPFDRLVEAIRQSSAKTQYIDTEFYPGPKTFAALDFKFDGVSTKQQRVFGCSGDFVFDTYNNGGNPSKWASACADDSGDFLASSLSASAARFVISLDAVTGEHVIINSSTHSKTSKTRNNTRTKTSTRTLTLFAYNVASGMSNFACGGLIYAGAITSNGVPVRTYLPCALGERAGLYDAVSGRVFWSAVANDDFTVEGASALCDPAAGETQVFASAAFDIIPPTVPVCAIPVSEYAQAGSGDFLAHFDGLENAGAGAHRTNPATWADLTGNIALRKTGTAGFSADAWTPDASSYFMGNSAAVKNALGGASPAFTLEMVISHLEATTNATQAEAWFFSGNSASARQLVLDSRSWEGNGTPLVAALQYRHSAWDAGNFIPAEDLTKWGERQYVAIVCDGRTATLYCDGNKYLHSMSGDVDPVSDLFTIGANYNGGGKLMNGSEICAVRMTSRVLTEDERMQNWFVDSQRFGMSEAPDGYRYTNDVIEVRVTKGVSGLEFSTDGGTTWAAGEAWMPINAAGTLSVRDAADHSRSVSFGNLPVGATVSGNDISFTPTHPREIAAPTLDLSGSSAWASSDWGASGWRMAGEAVAAPISGSAAINLSGGASLTLGADVALSSLTLNGSGNLVIFTDSHTFSAETVYAATGVKYIVIDGSADAGVWWTGLAGDDSMANGGNWEGGQVPAAGAVVNFSAIPSDTTINADAGRAFGMVTMGDAMITFTNALTVAGFSNPLKVTVGADSTVTIDNDVTLDAEPQRLCYTIMAGGTLHITGSVAINSSSIIYALYSGTSGGTIIVDDGIAVSGNGNVWWNARVLALGENGISFTDNAPFLFTVDDAEVYALGERTVLGTEGRGRFRSRYDDVFLCTTQYGSNRPATITIDGNFNGVNKNSTGSSAVNFDCWGHWRATGCGRVVCTSAFQSNRGLRVYDGATLAFNPGNKTIGHNDQTFYVYNQNGETAGGTLEVASSGTVTLTGNLTLADGTALAFNFTDRKTPPQLALSSGKTMTASGAVTVKVSATGIDRPKAGEYVLTTCGGFDAAGVTVVLAADAPKWAKDGLSVNGDGNIVIYVKPKGTMIIIK